jgi:glycerophosphoryl diester phosphodiesterase
MGQEQQPGRRLVLGAAVLGAAGMTAAGTAGTASAAERRGGDRPGGGLPVPTIVAHRGASGYRPEHTFGSYQLALDMGADVIEQDIVPTKDGHLVCRHENDITGTTDVADHPEFAGRKTTKTVDGKKLTGWFTEDFTLAELRTLRAKERLPEVRQHNTVYDGRWEVPLFEDVLKWARREGERRGRPVWLHIETKHPTYFRKLGLELEPRLAKLLRKYGRDRKDSPNFVQSFEPTSIKKLKGLVSCPGVCLLDALDTRPYDFVEAGDPRTVADLVKPEGLAWMAEFADGIGPWTDLVIPAKEDGSLGEPTTLVRDAHAQGLILHPYTMRNENVHLPANFRKGTNDADWGDVFGAFRTYLETGIDGIFTDFPDTGLLAAEEFRKS